MSQHNKAIVQQVNDAFSKGDLQAFLDLCSEDIAWTMAGQNTMKGKRAIYDFHEKNNMIGMSMTINEKHLIAEGDIVACIGEGTVGDWQGVFCDTYQFENGLIVEMSSLMQETSKKQ